MANVFWRFIAQQHLIFFLAIAFACGLKFPKFGEMAADEKVDTPYGEFKVVTGLLVVMIFFITGMRIEVKDVAATIKAPLALIVALVLILCVTPVLSIAPTHIPLAGVKEMGLGFAIFLAVPTSLTSGPALVSQGAPKAATFGVLTSIASNMIGCFTVPFVIKLVFSKTDVELDAVHLGLKLGATVLIPAIVGKCMHVVPGMSAVTHDFKAALIMGSNFFLSLLVYVTVSKSAAAVLALGSQQLDYAIAGAAALHMVLWLMNLFVWLLPVEKDFRRAVWLLASQKSFAVAVAVIAAFDDQTVNHGLLLVPVVMGQLVQLVLDSVVVGCWRGQDADDADVTQLREVMVQSQQKKEARQAASTSKSSKPRSSSQKPRSSSQKPRSSSQKPRSSSQKPRSSSSRPAGQSERDRSRSRGRDEERRERAHSRREGDRARSRSPPKQQRSSRDERGRREERKERRNPLKYSESVESLL